MSAPVRLEVVKNLAELKINSVSMHTPAWRVTDVAKLLFESPLRGQYTTTPGVDGEDPVPLRQSAAHWSLNFVMVGDVDHNGNPYADAGSHKARWIGFASNMNYLRTHVLTGRTLTGNRTRTATLQVAGEVSPRTAEVHASLIPGTFHNGVWRATLELHIPSGVFA